MVAKKTKITPKRPSLSFAKPKELSTPDKPAAMVTHMVVEVEDETGKSSAPLETIEKDTQAVEEAAQKLEKDIEKELKTEEMVPPKSKVVSEELNPEEETKKEVVKEFFKPDTGGVSPEISVYKSNPLKTLMVWIVVILVVALVTGGGLMIAVRGVPKVPSLAIKPTPTPTPRPPIPTPTPATVNRADVKLQVLNGGGIPGAGSKMKQFLESKGYAVSDIGNTDTFSYQDTVILVKPGKDAYLSLLKSDLKDSYTIGTAAAILSSDISFDARVIVGKD